MNEEPENHAPHNPEDRIWEMLKAMSTRIDLLVDSVDVLGQLVKLQGQRIDALEDRLKAAQADGY